MCAPVRAACFCMGWLEWAGKFIARFKLPRQFVFQKAPLPRGGTSKVLKYQLREQFWMAKRNEYRANNLSALWFIVRNHATTANLRQGGRARTRALCRDSEPETHHCKKTGTTAYCVVIDLGTKLRFAIRFDQHGRCSLRSEIILV
jgi:hypothetical protein